MNCNQVEGLLPHTLSPDNTPTWMTPPQPELLMYLGWCSTTPVGMILLWGDLHKLITTVPGGVQGNDRYAYVNNNPLRYTDPTGHMSTCGVEGGGGCGGSSSTTPQPNLPSGQGGTPTPHHCTSTPGSNSCSVVVIACQPTPTKYTNSYDDTHALHWTSNHNTKSSFAAFTNRLEERR